MNWIQEQALRIVYYDKYSCDEGFMEKDSSFSVQRRKIQVLVFEPYKHEHNISLSVMQKNFKVIEPKTQLKKIPFSRNRKFITQKHRTESLIYLA